MATCAAPHRTAQALIPAVASFDVQAYKKFFVDLGSAEKRVVQFKVMESLLGYEEPREEVVAWMELMVSEAAAKAAH